MGKVWPDAFQIVRCVLWPCTRESRSGWAHSGLLRAFAARRANVSSQPEEIVITGSTAWPGQVVRGVREAAREIFLAGLGWRGITTGSVCREQPLCSRLKINDPLSSVWRGSQGQNWPLWSIQDTTKSRLQSQTEKNKT